MKLMFILRAIYVAIVVTAYCIAAWTSHDNEVLMITMLIFGLIGCIMSTIPIQIEQHKRREPFALPILFLLVSACLFWWFFPDRLQDWLFIVQFHGFVLYLINAAGFFLGLALTPLLAKRKGVVDERIEKRKRFGIEQIKRSGFLPFMIFMAIGLLATFVFTIIWLQSVISDSSTIQQSVLWLAIVISMVIVIRLTFRSSIWGDPQKYNFYNQKTMDEYFGNNDID